MRNSEVEEFLDRKTVQQVNDKIEFLIKEKRPEKLVIAFCGIFSSGKSSLLNEILKQEFKLPTGGEPVTKFVTRIEYGEVFKAFYISHGSPVYLSSDEVKDLVRGKGNLPQTCQEIILQMPSEILKHNIVLMDTPGYEDSKRLEELTRTAVQTADMAVFCCNADIFGRQFEQKYFQELEDSIGNFLVVVNHADVIHTDKEFDSLVEYVNHMVSNRGKRKLSFFTDKTTFFTVGAGRYVDLDGLDQCLVNISTSSERNIQKIKQYATTKKLNYHLKAIQPMIEQSIERGHDLYSKTEQDLIRIIQRKRIEYESQCREVDRSIDSLRSYIRDIANRKIDKVCSAIEQLEKDNKHQEFVNLSAQILKKEFESLPGDIKLWKEKSSILKGKDLDLFSSNLIHLLETYKVPAPVGKNVKNRGVIGSFLVSAIVTTVSLSPYWDDGYDLEYHGYALAAKKSIKGTFLSKFNELVNKYLEGLRETSRPKMENVDASVLDRIADQLHEWDKCRQKVEKHLEKTNRILNNKKNILVIGSFACGKATLFNALLREEIMNMSPLPCAEFPTIVKSAGPEDEKRIVYEFPTYDDRGERQKVVVRPESDNITKELREAVNTGEKIDNSRFPVLRTIYSPQVDNRYNYCIINTYSYFENDVTMELVQKADVFIYVLDATRLYCGDDREIVERYFAGKQLDNIFFVINKLGQLNANNVPMLKKYILKQLRPVFTDKKGVFNNHLYDERIFYTDAYAALNTRMGRKTPIARNHAELIPDEDTGLPDLEKALYKFLA